MTMSTTTRMAMATTEAVAMMKEILSATTSVQAAAIAVAIKANIDTS